MSSKPSNNQNTFWTSYADLFMSLFFVMLVLYVVTFVVLRKEQAKYKADAEKLRKIQEIEKSVNGIDSSGQYFVYRPEYKKHVLKVQVKFSRNSASINDLSYTQKLDLTQAGRLIQKQIGKFKEENIKYLLIIEGQASKDNGNGHEYYNYKLSYDRALSLLSYWKDNDIKPGEGDLKNCELIISGSGEYGEPRDSINTMNQRFLIHIIPKIGAL